MPGFVPQPGLRFCAALWHHYRDCRRNKRGTINALAFELDAEANLLALQAELRGHTYRPGTSTCFVTGGAKPREVFAADLRDRIVHHLLVHHQERVFEPRFVHDSYACRRGRGTLAASDRLMAFLRRATANVRRGAWALKLDVARFFPSIHKETLYAILQRAIAHPELLWLTRTVLFHDPTGDYRYCTRPGSAPAPGGPGYPIPAAKSLFGKDNVRGLPIGNLTSQFWANVYLNELDQFVKRSLGCRLYLRYADDLVLLAESPDMLTAWGEAIAAFLAERLALRLRPGPNPPAPVRGGIDFVGWKTWWNRRLPRRRTLGNLQTRLEAFERRAVQPAFSGQAPRIALPGRGRGLQRRAPARRARLLTAACCATAGPGAPGPRCGSSTPGSRPCSSARAGALKPAGAGASWCGRPACRHSTGCCCAKPARTCWFLPGRAFHRALRTPAPAGRADPRSDPGPAAPGGLRLHGRLSAGLGGRLRAAGDPRQSRRRPGRPGPCRVASGLPTATGGCGAHSRVGFPMIGHRAAFVFFRSADTPRSLRPSRETPLAQAPRSAVAIGGNNMRAATGATPSYRRRSGRVRLTPHRGP